MLKRFFKILSLFLLSLLGLLVLASILVNINFVQNFLTNRITERLSENLKTQVSIRHVDFRLFNRMVVDSVLIRDQHKDTLLYADKVQVRITDFFFLKKRSVLHYVNLDHALVRLSRAPGDSTWNYAFLLKSLQGPPDTTPDHNPSRWDIRTLILHQFRLEQKDAWIGEDMGISLGDLSLQAQGIDYQNHRVDIPYISINLPEFHIRDYPGTRPGDTASGRNNSPGPTPGILQWNPSGWNLGIGNIRIRDGVFTLDNTDPAEQGPYFDPSHIHVQNIDANLVQTRIQGDTLSSSLQLSARERSGVEIRQLNCQLKISPVTMEFSRLDLQTNRSHIGDYFAMNFRDFSDMANFISRVRMNADFDKSRVSSHDIAFFAPSLRDWNMNFLVSGQASGSVDNMEGKKLHIDAGTNTHLHGSITIDGLPDISNTFMDLKADRLITNNRDLLLLFPSLKTTLPINIPALTAVSFNGSFTGFLSDFVAYGNFNTNLGYVHSDINLKSGGSRRIPVYSGSLSTKQMDLGALFGVNYLGPSTGTISGKGQGFTLDSLKMQVDADIAKLTLNGYPYQHLKAKGEFDGKLFNGNLLIRDPNADMDFKGFIDFKGKVPRFNFEANVDHSDLRALKITSDSLTFSGLLALHMAGSTIDNFTGDARLYRVNLYKSGRRVAFDSLRINSTVDGGGTKRLSLQGSELDGFIQGQFNIHQLPDAFQLFLSRYFPSQFSAPSRNLPVEDFRFSLELGQVNQFLKAFTRNLGGLDNSYFRGSLNTGLDSLELAADIPSFSYAGYRADNIRWRSSGTLNQLNLHLGTGNIFYGDSLWFPNASLACESAHDTSLIGLGMDIPSAQGRADLALRMVTNQEGYLFNILRGRLLLNDKEWNIAPGNEIRIGHGPVRVTGFRVSQNDQMISLGSDETDTSGNRFLIGFRNINLSDFSQLFHAPARLEGLATGRVVLDDPFGNLGLSADLEGSQFRLNDDSIGQISLKGNYTQATGLLPFQFSSTHTLVGGSLQFSGSSPKLQGSLHLDGEGLRFMAPYLSDYIGDLQGTISGNLNLAGTLARPDINGDLSLNDLGFTVNYLGTHYRLPSETLHFSENRISLDTASILDDFGDRALLSGEINHQRLNNLDFNIRLGTRKFQFLNTTYFDNKTYYGYAFVRGNIQFSGPVNHMQLVAKVAPEPGTHLYLPLSDSKDIGKHDFIYFKTIGKEIREPVARPKNLDLTFRLFAEMNRNARIDVILDASTGDAISSEGTGALNLNVSLNGDMTMYGNYSIEEGTYTFTLRHLIPKNFAIDPGSTITWNGSPYDAIVNVTAVYQVPSGTSLYNLLSPEAAGNPLFGQDVQRTQKVDVDLKLSGALQKPDIHFAISLPEESVAASYAVTRMKQILQDPSQLLNQVFSLLVFGQFFPETNAPTSSNLLVSGGLSSVGAILSSQGTSQLNNLLNRVIKDKTLGVNFRYNPYSATGESGDPMQRNALAVGVTKSFFNKRVRVEVGSQWDWGRSTGQYSYTTYFDPVGDFQLEYFVTPDGRFRLSAFRRSNYNVFLENDRTIYGAGIAYKRQFDFFRENFESAKKQQAKLDSISFIRSLRNQRVDSLREIRNSQYLDKKNHGFNLGLPSSTLRK